MATFSDAERTRSIQFIGKLMQACRGHDRELDNRLAELKQKLDKALAAIRANGKYDELRKKYFDYDIYGE